MNGATAIPESETADKGILLCRFGKAWSLGMGRLFWEMLSSETMGH